MKFSERVQKNSPSKPQLTPTILQMLSMYHLIQYDRSAYTHTNSTIAVDIKKNPEKRQQSIDFDFCKLSSSCDVVYKERW